MNKVNIVGGSGFIGTRLSKRLKESGIDFKIIDKKISIKFPELTSIADVRKLDDLKNTIDGKLIINLAAEHKDDVTPKSLYNEVNVEGARRICEVAEINNVNKIIFTSSVAVYGFAKIGTDEKGEINYFNEYGKTKYDAELVYKEWLAKDPDKRSLVIVRPTVVFGEQNRGNVYNLFKQIASGNFLMIGNGLNIKSMAYVENVAAFLEFSLSFGPGLHIYNYVDKPDFDMNTLVSNVKKSLGKNSNINIRIPYLVGFSIGCLFDFFGSLSGKKFSISSIRVKKFCSNSSYGTNLEKSEFIRPFSLEEGLNNTIKYEFVDRNVDEVFFSE